MSIDILRLMARISFWGAGLLGVASGALGIADLALPSGFCGALGAVIGMAGASLGSRVSKREIEAARDEAIAYAVAL